MLELANGQPRAVEVGLVGPEAHQGAGGSFGYATDHREIGNLVTVFKGHGVAVAITQHFHLKTPRQGVDHRDPDTVQTTREAVAGLGELAAGVQSGEDQLNARDTMFGMDVDGHATAIVGHLDTAILP